MNPIVTAAPSTPAQIMVVCAPNVLASGPTIANEMGTPPIETIQSRLDTRPSRSGATSRCSSVTHTTTRTVIDPSAMNATIMACQTAFTTPNPVVISIPSAQNR